MSKMRTPEIEVVRFTQNDVIVASGYTGPTLTVSNYKNGVPVDVSVKYATDPNKYSSAETLVALPETEGTNGNINGNTIDYLFSSDTYDDGSPMAQALLPNMDGVYHWDGSKWNHQ